MTSTQPHRALSNLLFALSIVEAIAGLVLLFAPGWILSLMTASSPLTANSFVLFLTQSIGLLAIGLAYLMCAAARDPVGYVAVIDAYIFILLAGAILIVYGIVALHIESYYPGSYLIIKAVGVTILAIIMIALRPKGARSA